MQRVASRDHRFPRQPVVYRDTDYVLDDHDRRTVLDGKAVFFTGRALAMQEAISAECNYREVFWYNLAPAADPSIMEDVIIPQQKVSGCHTHVDPQEVMRCGREARRRGFIIVSAGHSHGHGHCFTSFTDWDQHVRLVAESIGRASTITKTSRAAIQAEPVDSESEEACATVFRCTFQGQPDMTVWITAWQDLRPGDIEVVCAHRFRRVLSSFGTSTAREQHIVPALESISCPNCGHRDERRVEPKEVTVNVLGSIGIGKEEWQRLRAEVQAKVQAYAYSCYRDDRYDESHRDGYSDYVDDEPAHVQEAPGLGPDEEDAPPPYQLYRRRRRVAVIAPAVMEEAAAHSEVLRRARGWDSQANE